MAQEPIEVVLDRLAKQLNADYYVSLSEMDTEDVAAGMTARWELWNTGKSAGREPFIVEIFGTAQEVLDYLDTALATSSDWELTPEEAARIDAAFGRKNPPLIEPKELPKRE